MLLYLRTPLVNHSKHLAHTVELCACFFTKENISDFFGLFRCVYGECATEYTRFEFDKRVDYNDLMQHLFSPIDKKTLENEKLVLKEELGDTEYSQRLYEKIIRKFLDQKFSMNRYKSFSLKEVSDYHKKYYTPENAIIVDDENDFKISFQGFQTDNKIYKNPEINVSKFRFEKDKYILYIGRFGNGAFNWQMFFFFQFMRAYCFYKDRLFLHQYYSLDPKIYQYQDTTIIAIEDLDYSKLDQNFFEGFKDYFIKIIEHNYFKERFFLNEFIYGIPMSRTDVIKMYNQYSRQEFKTDFLDRLTGF